MKRFCTENSSIIVKFILTHVVMSLLGIMVGLAVIVIGGATSTITIVSSVFTVGFMCFMHYDDMYFYAVKEGIRLRAEGEKIDVFKGLKVTLIAYSPVIMVGIVAIVIDLAAGGVENASPIALLVYYIMQGSYLTLYGVREAIGVTGYIILTLLPAIIVSSLGYALGVKDKTLRGILGFQVKPPYDGPMERKPKNK